MNRIVIIFLATLTSKLKSRSTYKEYQVGSDGQIPKQSIPKRHFVVVVVIVKF